MKEVTCILGLLASSVILMSGCAGGSRQPMAMAEPLNLSAAQRESLRAAAESADAVAAYRLSLYYGSVLFDEKKYRYWLERSAQLGYEPAIKSLGNLLLESGNREDRIRGRQLLKQVHANGRASSGN